MPTKFRQTEIADKVYTYTPNTYTELIVVRCVLSSSKCTESFFGSGSAPDPAGKLTALPRPLVDTGGSSPKIPGVLLPSAPSSPSPFSPFSETGKIRTSYRPTFEIYH